MGTALDAFIEAKCGAVSPETAKGYRTAARRFDAIRQLPVDGVDASALQALLDSGECGPSMAKKAKNVLSAACRLAIAAGGASRNPCDLVSVAPLPPPKEPSQGLARLAAAIPSMRGPVGCVMGLICHCGLSLGEAIALRADDIGARRIAVSRRASRAIGGKASVVEYDSPRFVTMPPWLADGLLDLLDGADGASESPYVFGRGDEPGNMGSLSRSIRTIVEALGCDDCTCAQMRKYGKAQTRIRESRASAAGRAV